MVAYWYYGLGKRVIESGRSAALRWKMKKRHAIIENRIRKIFSAVFLESSSKFFYNRFKPCRPVLCMADSEYKEKVKVDDDKAKVEREYKDDSGNKVKEKHEVKAD